MTTDDIENFSDKVITVIKSYWKSGGFKDRKLTDIPTDAQQIAPKGYVDAQISSVTSLIPTATNKTVIPLPVVPLTVNANPNVITEFNTSSNTTAWLGRVNVPFKIVANKITVAGSWLISSSEAAVLSLYSEDGQTRVFSVTTAAFPNGNASLSTTLSAVSIAAGSYYICFIPTLGSGPASYFWEDDNGQGAAFLTSGITGKAVLAGTLAVTAGTAPATIDPTAISYANHKILYFRLDN